MKNVVISNDTWEKLMTIKIRNKKTMDWIIRDGMGWKISKDKK